MVSRGIYNALPWEEIGYEGFISPVPTTYRYDLLQKGNFLIKYFAVSMHITILTGLLSCTWDAYPKIFTLAQEHMNLLNNLEKKQLQRRFKKGYGWFL